MHLSRVAVLSALYAICYARTRPGNQAAKSGCGADINHADPSFLSAIADLSSQSNSSPSVSTAKSPTLLARQNIVNSISIPTYVHVITTNASAGSITPFMVAQQMQVMNKAYNPYNIKFRLVKADYTVNDRWATAAGTAMMELKSALRQGNYSALNLYFHSDLAGDILGTCTLPTDIGPGAPAPSLYAFDGCNMAGQTMPGGSIYGYNLGLTAVHETGHWLGLLHVFEGYSCSGTGDFIGDTPAQSTSTDGCPISPPKDSCPGVKGLDSVNNYMDYSTDACYQKFTTGQIARVRNLWAQFRNGR